MKHLQLVRVFALYENSNRNIELCRLVAFVWPNQMLPDISCENGGKFVQGVAAHL